MTLTEFGLANLAIAAGSVVQAASGVGAGFLMVPLLAFIDLGLVPGPMIAASLSLSGIMAWRERGAIDGQHLAPMVAGLAPGCAAGAWIVSVVPPAQLGIVFAVVIWLAIGLSVAGLNVPLSRTSALVAGAVGGTMGASSGIGAPVVAILYQHASGPQVRSTLALIYTVASALVIVMLAAFGQFGAADAAAALALVPGFLLGYWIANRLRRRLDAGTTRPLVLGVSGAAAVALFLRGLGG